MSKERMRSGRGWTGLLIGLIFWGASVAAAADPAKPETTPAQPAPGGWEKPIPLSFSIDYTLVSDYVFRGINLSEYAGEGREKPNHQLNLNVELDAGPVGTFGVNFWFEWFAGQEVLTPNSSDNLQEIDYTVYWSYEIEPAAATVELGWTAYTYPRVSGDLNKADEVYVKLSFDDARLFGSKNPVLNPYVYYGLDVDDGKQGSWLELGISHDFALAGLGGAGALEHVTVSPSLVLGIDHRYLDKYDLLGDGAEQEATRLANLVYGLAVSYDLGAALGMPETMGSLTITGFLNFSQALRDDLLNDELYGGLTVGCGW